MRDELQRLSNETQNIPSKSGNIAILEFGSTYPIVFEALGGSFRYMMSNSRMAELMHAGLRSTIKEGESLFMTEMLRAYQTNEEYYNREERRQLERAKQEQSDQEIKKKSVKHDRSKEQQSMIGQQLIVSCEMYSHSAIVQLEIDADTKIQTTRYFKIRGITYKDRELQKKELMYKKNGSLVVEITMP